MRKKILYPALLVLILQLFGSYLYADNKSPAADNPLITHKTFSKSDINKLAPAYLTNGICSERPAIVDVDGDGDFDMLLFKDGNVEYYKNTGTLEKPVLVLENKNYDRYTVTPFISEGLPTPIFFADSDGDGDMDMFAVKDKGYNMETERNDYRILYAENALDLDTGTLITIILILVIVLLLLAILR